MNTSKIHVYFRRVFHTLLFSWVGGTVATAPDCKSGTLETSEVRVLFCPLYKFEITKRKQVKMNEWQVDYLLKKNV